jgi:hypothetical protein
MKHDEAVDYSQNLIKIKKLAIEIEQCVNGKQTLEALERATELCIEARDMKTRMYILLPAPHIVKDE